ncbi:hypothetical protein CAEBREN_02564 [Caenorhabditis brenneri]|uniref:RING-type domain-containing protein n=1 Tax=Caenorhabditis brenneri TaxID=135651 RepID=G0N6T4_CAEBE|nr:hypothetical protein CAEBREN_02564 [Caenorhabditis brenneri]
MFVPSYLKILEVTPDYLIISKSQSTHVSIEFKNTFDKQAEFVFYPYLSHRNPVSIRPGESQHVLIEVREPGIYTSPLKIGWISINFNCFPLILPVCYVERLPEFPECTVCTIPFNETTVIPKSIPNCGHTFCNSCCERMKRDENTIVCSICRTTSVVRNGIRNLPRNFALLELLRNRELPRPPPVSQQNLTFPRIPCGQNNWTESEIFCLECESNYCKKCFDSIHSARALENHRKYPVSFPKCHNHLFRFADAVCTDSLCLSRGKPVCIPCLEGNHKLHQHESILKNMEENRKVLIEVQGALRQKKMKMKRLQISKTKAEEIKSDLALMQALIDCTSNQIKSKVVIVFGFLNYWFEKASEVLFKEYERETLNAIINQLESDETQVNVEHEPGSDSPSEEEELSQTVESIVDHLADAVTESIRLLEDSRATDDGNENEKPEVVPEGQEYFVDEPHEPLTRDTRPQLSSLETEQLVTATSAVMDAEDFEGHQSDLGEESKNAEVQEQREPDETENIIDEASRDYTAIRARFNLSNERPLIPKQVFKTNKSPLTSGSTSSPESCPMVAPSENRVAGSETSSSTPENSAILSELPSFKERIAKFEEQNRLQLLKKTMNCVPQTASLLAPVSSANPIVVVPKLTPPEEPNQPDETEKFLETSVESTVEVPDTKGIQTTSSENSNAAENLENAPDSNSMEGTDPVNVE